MSNNNNSFLLKIQAMLDKVKSLANIKKDLKTLEPKLKVKIKGTLDMVSTKKELNKNLKSIKPKVKVDADTTQATKKIKKLTQQKTKKTIKPTIDNTQIISDLKATQKETKSLFKRFLGSAVGTNLIRMSVQNVTKAIYEAITGVKELDKIKTDIQTVTGKGNFEVDYMMQDYNYMAKELSSTTKDIAKSANEFLRMGESVASTNELIKSSQMLSKIGMIESSDAASYLISCLKGYKLEAQDAIDVVSMLSSVDSNATVSAGGLAEALSRCTSVANNSGTSIERLIGYAATIGEVTQESMSVVGNSLKSMYSRLSNIKIGRFIDDETGESLSDIEAVLNKLGIKLRDSADSYRDFDDVLDDVGKRWESFTQVERNEISVAMAGTMQRNRFLALMDNYSNALKYSEVATNSAGSALERYGIYQDSIEAKANELTASIESLSTNIISEDLYSGIIKATTGIVEFLDKTNLLKSTLTAMIALGISKMFVSMGVGIVTAVKSTSQLTAVMALFDKGRSVKNLKAIGRACIGLSDRQLKLILSTKNLTYTQRLSILEGMGVEKQQRKQRLATLGLAAAEKKAANSTFSLKGAMDSLKVAIATNPIGIITTSIFTATMIISAFNQSQEELRQKIKESGDSFKSSITDIKEYKTKIAELHHTINDSSSSIEDVTNARKDLISIQNELIDKFGTEKTVINDVTKAVNGQTEALDQLTKVKWQEIKNELNNSGFWNNVINLLQGKKDNIERMLDEYGEKTIRGERAILIDLQGNIDKDKLTDGLIAELENIGIDIYVATDNLQRIRAFDSLTESISDTKGAMLSISGNAGEIYNKLLTLQSFLSSDDSFEKLYSRVERSANSYKELTDNYKEFYNQYILYEKILTDNSNYADLFKNITDAYKNYSDAYISGDEGKIKEATENYASVLTDAISKAIANEDTDVATYFENMYPTMQAIVSGWNFNIAFDANTDDLQNKVQTILEELKDENGRPLTEEEILGLGAVNKQYQDLVSIAHTYNMSIEEMIELLKGRNLIASMDYQGIVGLFGQEDVDKLSSEDLEIAYKIKNISNMTFEELQIAIQKIKESGNEIKLNISSSLTASKEKTDEFTSSLKSAYDAYNKLLSPAASSSEILGSLMTMNEAITKMGGKINWEFLGDIPETERLESLGDILNRISIQISDNLKESLHTGNEEYDKFIDTLIKGIVQQQKVASEFEGINGQIDYLQSSYKTLSDVLDAYNETGYMTLDNLQSLLTADENLIAMLEVKNGKLAINQAAYENLVSVQLAEYKTKLENAAAAEIEALAKEKAQKATEQNASASENAVAKIDAETSAIQRNTVAISENEIQKAKDSGVSENEIQQVLDKYNSIWDATQKGFSSGFSSFIGKTASSASKSTEKTLEDMQKEWKEKLDNCLTLYRSELDVGLIDFQTFLDKSKSLMDEYYQSGKISAKDYWDLVKDFYSTQKDIYDEVLSTVSRRYDTEIDRINDTIDGIEKQNDTLEKQKEKYDTILSAVQELIDSKKEEIETSVENLETENEKLDELVSNYDSVLSVVDKVYDTEIEKLQSEQQALDDKIAALQNANEEEEQAIALAKAKYELERAESQRTKLIYKNGQFVYTQDEEAIQEARGNLKNLETEEVIASLEKEKDVLQESIDLLNQYKEMWAEISNVYQDAVDKETAKNILGEDYETMILLNRVLDIEAFKDRYVAAQKQIDDNANLIASYQEKIAYYDKLSEKWNTIADAREKTLNKQLAAELWGSDWETQILEDRLGNFDVFKEEYLTIQDQIEDNTSLIESYQEKITYYENLKDQWSEISKAYENSVNDQYASMILGQNWEAEVLSGRLDTLNQFKDKYQSIQQSISDIAWQAANTRIDAAKEEEKGSQGTKGSVTISAGNTVSSDLSPASSKSHYELYDVRTGQTLASGFNSNEEAVRHIKDVASEAQGREFVKIRKYHKGLEEGYVGKALKDEKLELLQKAGDGSLEKELSSKEVPAILKEGEVVVNEEEQDDVVKALEFIHNMDIKQTPLYKMFFGSEVEQEALKFLPGTWDYKLPKYDTANIIENHTYNNSIVQNITQNFPNAIDISSAKVIESTMGHIMNRTFDKLEMDAYQDSMRRR